MDFNGTSPQCLNFMCLSTLCEYAVSIKILMDIEINNF